MSDKDVLSQLMTKKYGTDVFMSDCDRLSNNAKPANVLKWIHFTRGVCKERKKDDKDRPDNRLCEAIMCMDKNSAGARANSVAFLASTKIDQCRFNAKGGEIAKLANANGTIQHAFTNTSDHPTSSQVTSQDAEDKNTLLSCMEDFQFYFKYEELCQKAKLRAMANGIYNVKTCEDQANLLLKQDAQGHNLAQVGEDTVPDLDSVATNICAIAKKCKEDTKYKCEMSRHLIFYLMP